MRVTGLAAALIAVVFFFSGAQPALAYLEWLNTGFSITYRVISFAGDKTSIVYYSINVLDRIVSTSGYKFHIKVELDELTSKKSFTGYVDMYTAYLYIPLPNDPLYKDTVEKEGRITISIPMEIPGITERQSDMIYVYAVATFEVGQVVDYTIGEVSQIIRRAYECTGFFHSYHAKAYIDEETGLLLELKLYKGGENGTMVAQVSIFTVNGFSSNSGGGGGGGGISPATSIAIAMAVVGSFFILVVYLVLRKVASIYHAAMEASS